MHEFPKKLGNFTSVSDYKNLDNKQLEELLHEIKFTVAITNSSNNIPKMFAMGSTLIETFAVANTPLKLNGLTAALMSSEDFNDTLKEFALEYEQYTYTDPGTRLGMKIGMTALGIHFMNTHKEALIAAADSAPQTPPASTEELSTKYEDL